VVAERIAAVRRAAVESTAGVEAGAAEHTGAPGMFAEEAVVVVRTRAAGVALVEVVEQVGLAARAGADTTVAAGPVVERPAEFGSKRVPVGWRA